MKLFDTFIKVCHSDFSAELTNLKCTQLNEEKKTDYEVF